MNITSRAFSDGSPIPNKYTGVDADISPPLGWADIPDSAKSLALICDDPDAPSAAKPRPEGPWVHWVIYNIPANVRELPEAVERKPKPSVPAGAIQGKNDFDRDNIGYRGPMPPVGSGPHRYIFVLYALDRELNLDPQLADKARLLEAMQGCVLSTATLTGTFERK